MLFAEASRVLSAFSPKRVSMNFKIEVWSFVILSLFAAPLVLTRRVGGFGRASPAQLQRFLF